MLKKYDNQLFLKINHSPALSAFVFFSHCGAALATALAGLPIPLETILWPILAWSLYRTLTHHALRLGGDAVVALHLRNDDALVIHTRDGSHCRVRLATAFVHPGVVILTFAPGHPRHRAHVVLSADAVDSNAFRRLRARMTTKNWLA